VGLIGDSTNIPVVVPATCTSSAYMFDDGSLAIRSLPAGKYVVAAGIRGVGFGGSCGVSSTFAFQTVVGLSN
jgi:hypothetical protein